MNRYGRRAHEHWRKWLPSRYAKLESPNQFFEDMGEQIQVEVEQLTQSLAGDDPPGETYMEKLGRLNMARATAESQVLREVALLEPEPGLEN